MLPTLQRLSEPDMPKLAEQLLDAQVRFFLEDFQGESLAEHLRSEANAYCDLLETVSVRDLISSDTLIAFVQRNLLGYSPTEALREQGVMLFELAMNNPDHQQQPLRQLINRQIYDLMVKRLLDRPDLRREIVSNALQTPLFTRLLTQVVYENISDFLSANHVIRRKLPRLQKLMDSGERLLREKLDLDLADRIKAFIHDNILRSINLSEDLICDALSNRNLSDFADSLWPKLERYELGQATRHLETQGLSYLVVLYWNQIRQTDYMHQQVELLIRGWYEHAGHIPAMNVLQSFGIERDHIAREVVVLGQPLFNAWVQSGYIGSRLREHVERFYQADSTQQILQAAQAGDT